MAHVLVIEDERNILQVLSEALALDGHTVSVAPDGLQGLSTLFRYPLPDVVLVDLLMPGLLGGAVVAAMRADPKLAGIPVVIITGIVPDSSELPPLGTYQAIFSKPFDLNDLLETVGALAPQGRAAGGLNLVQRG